MKGFPKHLNTKFDVEFCLANFPDEAKEFLTKKIAEVPQWLLVSKLSDGDAGITDDTHKVVENKDMTTGEVKERYQYEFKDDPNCELFRLGFTVEEATSLINAI